MLWTPFLLRCAPGEPGARVSIAAVQAAVCAEFGVPLGELVGRSRHRSVYVPRGIAMLLARELTGQSLPQIGRRFDRDHTTVMQATQSIPALLRRDPEMAARAARARGAALMAVSRRIA